MSKAKKFIQNLVQEVRYKITWPPYHRLQDSSLLVLLSSLVFALLIGVMDWFLRRTFVWFYNAF